MKWKLAFIKRLSGTLGCARTTKAGGLGSLPGQVIHDTRDPDFCFRNLVHFHLRNRKWPRPHRLRFNGCTARSSQSYDHCYWRRASGHENHAVAMTKYCLGTVKLCFLPMVGNCNTCPSHFSLPVRLRVFHDLFRLLNSERPMLVDNRQAKILRGFGLGVLMRGFGLGVLMGDCVGAWFNLKAKRWIALWHHFHNEPVSSQCN